MQKSTEKTNTKIKRPPIVVVMGHVDHGKSTLLDYIRKTNITESEAGGITQKMSAYEVEFIPENKSESEKITFIDTPGHESFSKMRERGAKIADVAILIVSAEDGVKAQTKEAWKTIVENKIPVVVAINKIDKPNANIEKTKIELAENEIYVESYGGNIPCAEISAKTGIGIDNLLSLISIISDIEDFRGNPNVNGEGFVLESNMDAKRGIEATLLIKNGTLNRGMFVVVEDAICGTSIMQNFKGGKLDIATFSSPVRLVGFSKIPKIGSDFFSFQNRKEAEKYIEEWKNESKYSGDKKIVEGKINKNKKTIAIILKANIAGELEAIEKEIKKITTENAEFRIVHQGVGPISESDIKSIADISNALVLGFNVKSDKNAEDLCLKENIQVHCFDIIYKLTEWLTEELEKRRPRMETVETIGKAKILKVFSKTKERQVVGGKVLEGRIVLDKSVKILRRDSEIGKARIINLEKSKSKTSEVEEGTEFGMLIESKVEIAPQDVLECFDLVQK